ncbi:hypothetical protein KC734_21670 [candidate division KSB1 bacterium]|nr:hypothetical protein [candidate division KSB1 bacterium]
MVYEEVFEPIDVITVFQNGKLQPLRFKWKDSVYRISKVQSHWMVPQAQGRAYHFAVTTGSPDSFEIIFSDSDLKWQLARVAMDG